MKTLILKQEREWSVDGFAYAVFILDDNGLVIDSSQNYEDEDIFHNSLSDAVRHLTDPNNFNLKAFL